MPLNDLSLVNLPARRDRQNQHHQPPLLDPIDDPPVPDANPQSAVLAYQPLRA